MFEITKDQLRGLSAGDFRELVARLCEAEVAKFGTPVSSVKWGGSENAPDGGLDVDCHVLNGEFRGDFVPRAWTGIQVKKPSMPPGAIADEMSPKGQLRPVFRDLARANGCYIIASLDDDPGRTALSNRYKEMDKQIGPTRDLGDLQIAFYGRNEIVQWLRGFPSVQLWVREKLGIPLEGWKQHGRWTRVPPHDDDQLISRKGISVVLPERRGEKLEIEQGIDGIRELVRTSDKAVRIIGLSGVGKTRIIQALFEETVGECPLAGSLAIYADLSENPDPSAHAMLRRLHTERRPAIVVLDNCPPDAHSSLVGLITEATEIKLITIEYDVREDKPELTSVVRINAEGPDIVEELIQRRCPALGQVNAERIAAFSGGNARLALVLADAVSHGESLSDLSDAELFNRLFHQRGDSDPQLQEAAEVLSLVYSFSVNADQDGVDELEVLASLFSGNRLALYREAQRLLERQLSQKRGDWRAILPPVVSNHLASKALSAIPKSSIQDAFQHLPNARLLISFAKRLGYLHDHEVAQGIVSSWLARGGYLHEIELLDSEGLRLLENAAPASPDSVLDAIEARFKKSDSGNGDPDSIHLGSTVAEILHAIAFWPEYFKRCIGLLTTALLSKHDQHDGNRSTERLCSLFSLYHSGTHANLETRANVVRHFLFSSDRNKMELGFNMLKSALSNDHNFSLGKLEFGARPRDYGYHPQSNEELKNWFEEFTKMAREIATSDNAGMSARARDLLANNLRYLWSVHSIRPQLYKISKTLNEQHPWIQGWQAVRSIKHYDCTNEDSVHNLSDPGLLDELDQLLKPTAIEDEIRTYVFSNDITLATMDDKFESDDEADWNALMQRAADRSFTLGEVAAYDLRIVDELIRDFFSKFDGYHFHFGKGLASNSSDLLVLWERLVRHLERAGDNARNCAILCGVLNVIGEREITLAENILDSAIENSSLRKFIVPIQRTIALDQRGIQRLLTSLDFDDTPIHQYSDLAWHRPISILSEIDVERLMSKVLGNCDGAVIVLEGLSIRLSVLKGEDDDTLSTNLQKVGLCAAIQFFGDKEGQNNPLSDHRISKILENCLDIDQFPEQVEDLFETFFAALENRYGYLSGMNKTVSILAKNAPELFLDGIFLRKNINDAIRYNLKSGRSSDADPISKIDLTALFDWCRRGDFHARLILLSESIDPFVDDPEGNDVIFSEQARAIISEARDVSIILSNFANTVSLGSSWGSLADKIARRSRPFESLLQDDRPEIRRAAEEQIQRIRKWEVQERNTDRLLDMQRELSFE